MNSSVSQTKVSLSSSVPRCRRHIRNRPLNENWRDKFTIYSWVVDRSRRRETHEFTPGMNSDTLRYSGEEHDLPVHDERLLETVTSVAFIPSTFVNAVVESDQRVLSIPRASVERQVLHWIQPSTMHSILPLIRRIVTSSRC